MPQRNPCYPRSRMEALGGLRDKWVVQLGSSGSIQMATTWALFFHPALHKPWFTMGVHIPCYEGSSTTYNSPHTQPPTLSKRTFPEHSSHPDFRTSSPRYNSSAPCRDNKEPCHCSMRTGNEHIAWLDLVVVHPPTHHQCHLNHHLKPPSSSPPPSPSAAAARQPRPPPPLPSPTTVTRRQMAQC